MLGRARFLTALVVVLASGASGACGTPPDAKQPLTTATAKVAPKEDEETRFLLAHAMLARAETVGRAHAGTGAMWKRPYARPDPRGASALASVWFTAYPASTLAPQGRSVLATLGDPALWKVFRDLGIKGMHTGPMKRSGGITGRAYTPTVDGNFDRIESAIDPSFGTEDQYVALTKTARESGAAVIGDIIPGHSGKGADFRLAERGYGDYPGLYHMVEIKQEDWALLPAVPSGKDSVNLKPEVVDTLKARGYVVGQLPRTIFQEKGVKDTDWSATAPVAGEGGKTRRWVYLHYFKEGQPTFNWLDPTFAAQRLLVGDAIHSIETLGERVLRLDANGFLGIEAAEPRAWSEGHPLSVTSNQLLGGMVRKLGGFTFQELNLTFDDLVEMSRGGADLSYDFVARPAYHHALVTGDAGFLRLVLAEQKKYGIDPAGLVHALQNHDELTLELVHFWTKHANDTFTFRGKPMKGSAVRDVIRQEMHDRLLAAPYNLKASNGVSCTTASVVAASLGLKSMDNLPPADREAIQRGHLLLAMFNAMQPGVFALSGWDLVGAATLPGEAVKARLADGDTRWINRGSYALLSTEKDLTVSGAGLPRTTALYGPLDTQLAEPTSFASRLRKMLAVRAELRLSEGTQLAVPETTAKGLLVLVHKLPAGGLEVTALNFGRTPVDESVAIEAAKDGAGASDLLDAARPKATLAGKRLRLQLAGHEGRAFRIE